ncbi:MAG TPA: hypothetical protein VFY39_00965, partial [Gammaproteobacteria bacterium]|nr:hypothetical protein [Gammaproteobacteria bacterium]
MLAHRERQRIIERRIDALLAEARQLNLTADDVLRIFSKTSCRHQFRDRRLTGGNGEIGMGQIVVDVRDLSRWF